MPAQPPQDDEEREAEIEAAILPEVIWAMSQLTNNKGPDVDTILTELLRPYHPQPSQPCSRKFGE